MSLSIPKFLLAVFLVPALLSCGPRLPPVLVSDGGNCRIFFDEKFDEYVEYIENVRRVTGCQQKNLARCPPAIRLEFVDYPKHIARKSFEDPDFAKRDFPRARLRTTSLVNYDIWLSQNFNSEPWDEMGYEVRFRDRSGHQLVSMIAAGKRDLPDCRNYVVLTAGTSVDMDIPLIGKNFSKLGGNILQVRVGYLFKPRGTPKALDGTLPAFGLAVSDSISITVD